MRKRNKAPPPSRACRSAGGAPATAALAIATLALAVGSVSPAPAQTYTDAVSREVSIFNTPVPDDAVSREVSALNNTVSDDAVSREVSVLSGAQDLDAVSREVSAFNGVMYVEISSSGPALALPVSGTLPQQLATLNAAPPAFDPNTWLPVHRRNINIDDQFLCGGVPDPLARGYVSADTYLDSLGYPADEVTFDNCSSAFYAFPFMLPDDAVPGSARLSGSANVDDQGVLWLNTTRVSALMTTPGCTPIDPADPLDPCYLQQDAGKDWMDSQLRRVLTWPTLDPFETPLPGAFIYGQNVLIFAVAGDAQAFEPTGVEFAAAVIYAKRGDTNCDGAVDFADIDPFVAALGGPTGYAAAYPMCFWLTADTNCDGVVDFADIDPFVACLSGNCACP